MAEIKTYLDSISDVDLLNIVGKERLVSMFKKIILARRFEEKVEELYLKMALITGPCHLYLGMEAIASGITEAMDKEDYILSTYRGHGHAVTKGVPVEKILAELMGREDGTCKGLGGSMHAATWIESRLLLATAIVGSNISIAAGVGLKLKRFGGKNVVVCFFGDGAVNSGAFNEGLNLASVWRVPVIYVCENNQYAMSLPLSKGIASTIAERASSYGIKTFVVNGNDPVSVYLAAKESREICVSGEGPCFIEARTYRLKGHGIYDKALYRPENEVREWLSREPLENFKERLLNLGVINESEYQRIEEDIMARINEAVTKARSSKVMDFSRLKEFVYPG